MTLTFWWGAFLTAGFMLCVLIFVGIKTKRKNIEEWRERVQYMEKLKREVEEVRKDMNLDLKEFQDKLDGIASKLSSRGEKKI